jgi:hypothetical protein
MRRFTFALAILAASAVQPALAQRQCSNLADQTTFEVQALRSAIMVLATGCHEDDRYNAFIRRFQPDLMANEHSVNAYFKRRYGGRAQTEHDRFVTDLANAVSRGGSQYGGDFCPRNGLIFGEVMALRNGSELGEFAASKDLIPPTMTICHEAPAPTGKKPAAKPVAKKVASAK